MAKGSALPAVDARNTAYYNAATGGPYLVVTWSEAEDAMDAAQSLALEALGDACCRETEAFRARGASDPTYCLELFRRAMEDRLQDAWQHLMACFGGSVRAWLYRHPRRASALAYQDETFYLTGTFAKLWETNQRRAIILTSLPALLVYLQRCLHTVVMEEVRFWEGSRERRVIQVPIEDGEAVEDGSSLEGALIAREDLADLLSCANDERERHLIIRRWLHGYPPSEIVRRWPEEFPAVREVYQLLQNILARYERRFRRDDA